MSDLSELLSTVPIMHGTGYNHPSSSTADGPSTIPSSLSSLPILQGAGIIHGQYNPYFARTYEPPSSSAPKPGPHCLGEINNDNDSDNDIINSVGLPSRSNANSDHSHTDFVELSVEQKVVALTHILDGQPSLKMLRALIPLHVSVSYHHVDHRHKSKDELIHTLRQHQCTEVCLVRRVDIACTNLCHLPCLPLNTFEFSSSVLKLRSSSTHKRKNSKHSSIPKKKARSGEHQLGDKPTDWPTLLSSSEKLDIMRESYEAGNNNAIKSVECSFCGMKEKVGAAVSIPCSDLDISLLRTAVELLRERLKQPLIEAFKPSTIENSCYQVCSLCRREICNAKNSNNGVSKEFVRLPLRSYANGTWTGNVPDALKGLTFLEEQCIARARATRCMYKLELGPSGQFASRGNVCIFPQDPGPLVTCLPPPLLQIQDEVCVVLVGSPSTPVTIDMLSKTPLLVRRKRIIAALRWLKVNNPLYSDLDLEDMEHSASSYPDYGIPIPVQAIIRVESNSEGDSYTDQNAQDMFHDNVSTAGMPASTVVDADNIESTYRMRKLNALRRLKVATEPFVKFPSGSTPLSTIKNPSLYGQLWPTLFPYGVGMMESSLQRAVDSVSFRSIDPSKHISYLLSSVPNHRFQTHLSFIFVMGNILQRRQTSYAAKLAVKRSWFPRVDSLLLKISADTIAQYTDKLQKNSFARPETEGEKAASQLIRYISYIGEHVPGSMGEVQKLRDELFSIVHTNGLPHVFLTLNPSDTNNPVAQVLAGRDIDLDKFFDDLSLGSENLERSRHIAQNPVAGARFFDHSVHILIDILLGTRRHNGQGVFGEVEVYYGVVEAQGRGSLHIHLLVWLRNGLSPNKIHERRLSSPEWEKQLIDWYDDVFSHNIPDGTSPYDRPPNTYLRQPVMSRPLDPSSDNYWASLDQDLRNVLDNTGMMHQHNATCFKHLPLNLRALRDDDQDCRFQLPRDIEEETHFDEDGYLVLRCNNGFVNGHNPLITAALRCNSDAKPIGSGTVAMAMFQYFGNYTAKHTMDTAFVFSALCSSIKVLSDEPPKDIDGNIDTYERSRLLLIKTVNRIIGKRELSGPQIASKLIGVPSCYTNRRYPVFYWSGILREIANDVFFCEQIDEEDCTETDRDGPDGHVFLPQDNPESYVVLTQQMVARSASESTPTTTPVAHNSLFNDIFYRPAVLTNTCTWDLFRLYSKERLPESKQQYKTYLRFKEGHPQYNTHCFKKIDPAVDSLRVPVLKGHPIPRSDHSDQHLKYIVAMMILFKPWSFNESSPVKDKSSGWETAFSTWKTSASFKDHLQTMNNMQLLYETKDARLDYSAMRRKRRHLLASHYAAVVEEEDYDPAWENAMQTPVETDSAYENDADSYDDISPEVQSIVDYTDRHGFYSAVSCVSEDGTNLREQTSLATEDDRALVTAFAKSIMQLKASLLTARTNAMNESVARLHWHHNHSNVVPRPFATSIQKEIERARQFYLKDHTHGETWSALEPFQQLAVMLIDKHTLNEQQTFAFLLLIDTITRQWKNDKSVSPLRMLVTGPGGTGKSRLFSAWKEFHTAHDREHEFRLTAPTGVVASDIGGSTVHSEVSLRVSRKNMKANDKNGQNIRSQLETRLAPVRTLVVDEIYFMSPGNLSILTEYCSLAKGSTEHPFGGLNLLTCGDPAQLPPPMDKPLFDRNLVRCYQSNQLNALNDETQHNVRGIQAWHQVDKVVVLTEIMRQKGDPLLLDILGRLRTGTCTAADKNILDQYVLSNDSCSQATLDLPSIKRWVANPSTACPLITYTNAARDAHNVRCARAFARETKQTFHWYHSTDTRGRGGAKRILEGAAAEAAWRVPVKSAKDLGGKVPLIPGIQVFCTENIATELGLSNGSRGTLVSVTYECRGPLRYGVSAIVDFPGFRGPDPDRLQRVVLKPVEQSIKFTLPNSDRVYSATRNQIPLIPAFSFTSHNSQGRSLDVACIDLASCRTIQSAYVMLSRLRTLKGLCILRPFPLSKIQNHVSEELRDEMRRTERLAAQTKLDSRAPLAWYYSRFPYTPNCLEASNVSSSVPRLHAFT